MNNTVEDMDAATAAMHREFAVLQKAIWAGERIRDTEEGPGDIARLVEGVLVLLQRAMPPTVRGL